MKFSQLIILCFLLLILPEDVRSQSFIGKTAVELKTMQKDALENEDYDLAEKIKQQLLIIDKNSGEIKVLQKEKETAILIEDYDRVIAIDKEIESLRNGESIKKVKVEKKKNIVQKKRIISPPKLVEKYYKNGKLSAKGYVEDGDENGLWELFTKSGIKNMSGQVLNGKPIGSWNIMNKTGEVTYVSDFSVQMSKMNAIDRKIYNLIYKTINN